jgi:hypothetical protein
MKEAQVEVNLRMCGKGAVDDLFENYPELEPRTKLEGRWDGAKLSWHLQGSFSLIWHPCHRFT